MGEVMLHPRTLRRAPPRHRRRRPVGLVLLLHALHQLLLLVLHDLLGMDPAFHPRFDSTWLRDHWWYQLSDTDLC